jgi:tripartite-type tricarboxylate transporter receptor subunit TctC
MRVRTFVTAAAAVLVALACGSAAAPAQSAAEFYKGKDLRILIGAGVGGTYGLYALLAARHMRKHIPGEPNVITQNMPGAGGLNALAYSYNVAPKDGTLMHLVHAEVLFETLLSPGAKFNARDYQWIGRFADADFIGVASRKSGVTSLEDAKKRQVLMGATGRQSVTGLPPLMFNRAAGTMFKVIAGYKGTNDIYIAMERGEVDGVAVSWANAKVIHGAAMAKGDLVPFFTVADERIPELPNVPTITEFGQDENEKTFIRIYTSSATIGRSLAFPPGVPADRVAALREAYDKTMKDPEFLAEVQSKNILLTGMSGEKLKAYVDGVMATPAARVEAARKVYADILAAN